MKNKKTAAILLVGAAAFAYYKYSKMNPEERVRFVEGLKEKGKSLAGLAMPGVQNLISGLGSTGASKVSA